MNNAILKFTPEILNDLHGLLPFILLSNDIKFIGYNNELYRGKLEMINLRVSSSVHFKEGFGIYSLHFEQDSKCWITLKEIKLEQLLKTNES